MTLLLYRGSDSETAARTNALSAMSITRIKTVFSRITQEFLLAQVRMVLYRVNYLIFYGIP